MREAFVWAKGKGGSEYEKEDKRLMESKLNLFDPSEMWKGRVAILPPQFYLILNSFCF